ncbi:MAG: Na+/H+ antiporter NhaA [Lapillicoccus sp.]
MVTSSSVADRGAPEDPVVGQTPRDPSGTPSTLRAFLATEASSAGVLVAAILAALVWANVDLGSYEAFWRTELAVDLGGRGVSLSLRDWVNSGLMTFFFLVIGLEARRELDLGELRERRRFLLPLVVGLLGMAVPIAIYLAVTAGSGAGHGWGVAMSTDTALALGFLSLIGQGVSDKVRVFLLTAFVVDDVVALAVIAVVYSGAIAWLPILVALVLFAIFLAVMRVGVRQPAAYAVLGFAVWIALLESGIDPVVTGLAIGLAGSAYSPSRDTLERASSLFRSFREQPTAEVARDAVLGLRSTLSPNARLQRFYLPWTSYVIVPLFGLANAGFAIDAGFLGRALTSPVALGVVAAYVLGKPVAVLAASWGVTTMSRGRIRPPVGWAAIAGSGTIAGTAFTVSLLIAALAFTGPELAEVKLGVLLAAVLSVILTAVVFRVTDLLPPQRRARALLGRADLLIDLEVPVDDDRDHYRGPRDAVVTLVEYGDFECPYCGLAEPVARAELAHDTDVRFVWRHLPLVDVHPRAQLAAEAAEAADAQGAFWPMHDLLLTRQEHLTPNDLLAYADSLGLDRQRFHEDLANHTHVGRVARDVDSADLSSVSGTPTFFVNGRRFYGTYDRRTLRAAVTAARERRLATETRETRETEQPPGS